MQVSVGCWICHYLMSRANDVFLTHVLHILSLDFHHDIWPSIVLGELDLGQWGTVRVAVHQLLAQLQDMSILFHSSLIKFLQ